MWYTPQEVWYTRQKVWYTSITLFGDNPENTARGKESEEEGESFASCHDELSYHLRVIVGTAWN